jgi:hypothetical protein
VQRYCFKFCQKLGDTRAKTICKIQQAFSDDATGSLKLMSDSTALKVAACQQTVTSILADHHRAQMLKSLTKCRHQSWRTIGLTIQEIADEVGISKGSANTILTENLGL